MRWYTISAGVCRPDRKRSSRVSSTLVESALAGRNEAGSFVVAS